MADEVAAWLDEECRHHRSIRIPHPTRFPCRAHRQNTRRHRQIETRVGSLLALNSPFARRCSTVCDCLQRQLHRSDAIKTQGLRELADLELRRVSYAAAKIRVGAGEEGEGEGGRGREEEGGGKRGERLRSKIETHRHTDTQTHKCYVWCNARGGGRRTTAGCRGTCSLA